MQDQGVLTAMSHAAQQAELTSPLGEGLSHPPAPAAGNTVYLSSSRSI